MQVTVSGVDSHGAPAALVGAVHFASSDPHAVLPGDAQVSLAPSASRTFAVTLVTAGSQTITVTGPDKKGHELGVVVSHAPAAQLQAALAQGCGPFDLTVSAFDSWGNPAPDYGGTVHFANPSGVAPADYAFTTADAGKHVFHIATGGALLMRGITASDNAGAVTASAPASPPGWCSVGPEMADVVAVAAAPDDPQTVYAGTGGGMYRSRDGGATWKEFNGGISGQRFAFAMLPTAGTAPSVFLGAFGGAYSATRDATAWTPLPTPINAGGQAQALAADPGHPGTVYVATGPGVNGLGLLRTTNGGASWDANGALPCPNGAHQLSVDPVSSAVYAACEADGLFRGAYPLTTWSKIAAPVSSAEAVFASGTGVLLVSDFSSTWASTDGGATWSAQPGAAMRSAIQVPGQPSSVWAMTFSGVAHSSDGGATWAPPSYLSLVSFALAGSSLYAGQWIDGVARSTDGGATWSTSNSGMRAGVVTSFASTGGAIYAGTYEGVYQSRDKGETWTGPALRGSVISTVIVDPKTPSTLYVDFSKSTDSGATWTSWRPASTAQLRTLAIDPSAPSTLYAGLDSGIQKSADGAATWSASGLSGSPVTSVAVDPASSSRVFAVTTNGPYRSSDAGATWVPVGTGLPAGSRWPHPVLVAQDSTVYLGTDTGVYRSTDGGTTFTAAFSQLGFWVLSLSGDPAAPHVLYASSTDSIVKSTDSGATWRAVADGFPPSAQVRAVLVDPSDPSIVYAGTTAMSVYRSVNGGN